MTSKPNFRYPPVILAGALFAVAAWLFSAPGVRAADLNDNQWQVAAADRVETATAVVTSTSAVEVIIDSPYNVCHPARGKCAKLGGNIYFAVQ